MKFLSILCLALFTISVWSDPAPFGLEIGKATVNDVKAKYKITKTGINKYSHGEMYDVNVSNIKFDGLRKVTVIFSKQGVLMAVLTELPKSKFDYLYGGLAKKYKLISKEIPFVGNKSAKFVNGNTEITLNAPHMSFQMDMNYINKGLYASFKNRRKQEKQQKRSRELNQL